MKPVFGYADPVEHWRQRLADGLAHNLSLVIAKAVHGLLAAGQPPSEVVRQAALFGTRNRDGWDTGLTILTALGQLLPFLPEEEKHLALFHGVRRVADGLRWCISTPGPNAAGKPDRPRHLEAVAAALGGRAPSRGG